jgi:hypothetical protein
VDARVAADARRTRRHTHPAVFGALELPFSAAVGFLQIAIPYDFAKRGVSLAAIGSLSAVAFLPHAWKFLWVPLLDAGPRRRTWYVLWSAFTGLTLLGIALFPDPLRHIALFTALVTASQVGAATSSACVEALMALTAAPLEKARAGGFKMAGNVGGIGLLGTLPIVLGSTRLGGFAMVAVVALSAAFVLRVAPEPEGAPTAVSRGAVATAVGRVRSLLRDIGQTLRSRQGWTGVVFCAAPVGCGALVNLYSAMAGPYRAPASMVAFVNGIGGGLVGATGALAGGYFADRVNRRFAYCASAFVTALVCFGMALAPMDGATYAAGTLAYRFANGVTMAAFAGMVLELVGHDPAVATKYTLFVAISNQAISYVTYLDGRASEFRDSGPVATVVSDGVLTLVGVAIVGTMTLLLRRQTPATGTGLPPPRAER